jgi:hypothetical protein
MLPPAAERAKLRSTLDQLAAAVEELLLGGLTTANDQTRRAIEQTLQEAARLRLLRFGGTLRVVADDLARFQAQDPLLSRKRLTFFINRAWLLARGMARALEKEDEKEFDRLTHVPGSQPLASVEVACLGVWKKLTATVVQFQFRFRALSASGPVKAGDAVYWSCVQPLRYKGFAPEAYLYLDQKQKFTPSVFLERNATTITNAAVAADEVGGWRLSLTDKSTVTANAPFGDWDRFLDWNPAGALGRLNAQSPGPLDVATELQEEVVLHGYTIGKPTDGDEPGLTAYPVTAAGREFYAIVGAGLEGKALKAALDDMRKSGTLPPLFGLMHYERCRLVLQPLSTFPATGPEYITVSNEKVDKGALKAAMLRELF